MEDYIARALRGCKAEYADVRLSTVRSTAIRIKDSLVDASQSSSSCICARVLLEGSWGMASTTEVSRESFSAALKKAALLAKSAPGKEKIAHEVSWSKEFAHSPKEDPDIGEKVKRALELESALRQAGISNTSVFVSSALLEKKFQNSHGSRLSQSYPLTYVNMSCVAKGDGRAAQGFETKASQAGYEIVDSCFDIAPLVPQKALRGLLALPSPKGKQAVIIDGKMAGVFAHEAIGHACEADSILSNESILKGRIGQQVGSPLVTIVDDATYGGFGSFYFDDEGVPAKRKLLLEKGRLVSYLHSLSSASQLGFPPTGNCRAQSCSDFPIVRMSNTHILPGTQKKEELFESVRSGIYVKGMKGGSVEPLTGHFVFAAEEGFQIEKGEITKPLRDVMLSGEILSTLHKVDAVCDDFTTSPGFCGKSGQSVPVGDGGPHILIRGILVG